ncbi:MAG: SUMF1/EgtB/PvdO family nonheme iron enzyme [bacterium]|nr:SUMF1/EgtB/PvdO family nonheme iron enzyme [bacterium]
MHSEPGRERATAEELVPIVEEALAKVDVGGLTARELLENIRDESGLLTGWSEDSFGFLHLGFQEYLAARHVANRFVEDQGPLRALAARFGESWWREATLLLLAAGEPPLFKPLFEEVWKHEPKEGFEELALGCVREAAEVSLAPFEEVLARDPGKDDGALWRKQALALRVLRDRAPERVDALAEVLAQHPSPEIAETFERAPAVHKGAAQSKRGEHELILIPAGKFQMGSTKKEQKRWAESKSEASWFANESPRHLVELEAFQLCKHPVTNAQYARFLEEHPETSEPERWSDREYNHEDQPVVGVTWHEAQAYCEWAGLVLPTEAQWEYACRAGETTAFWAGDGEDDLARVGWYAKNSRGRPHPVGEKPENPFGLLDMHGNVFEWCHDWHRPYSNPAQAGSGERTGEGGSNRVYRGGCFDRGAQSARSACRGGLHPSFRWGLVGFRPAKRLP